MSVAKIIEISAESTTSFEEAIQPGRGPSVSSLPLLKGVAEAALTARIGRAQFHRAHSPSKKEGTVAIYHNPGPQRYGTLPLQGFLPAQRPFSTCIL